MVTMKTSMVTNSRIGVNTNHFFSFELACFMIYDMLGKNLSSRKSLGVFYIYIY